MALKRYITEIGMGVDVHGQDYNLAAKRAVSDAIRHSSLNFFQTLEKSPSEMHITVKIGVPKPTLINSSEIAEELPYGTVTVEAEAGATVTADVSALDTTQAAAVAVAETKVCA